jgi:cobalt-zinc-cadmium efflux system membrane fusion protein
MNNLIFHSVAVALLLIGSAGCGREGARDASVASAASRVASDTGGGDRLEATEEQLKSMKTAPAIVRSVPTIEEATGKVAFNEDAITPVYSPHTGRVVELLAKPGDYIAKGSPLLIIDSPEVVEAENEFLSGRAALAKAQALLRQAQRNRDRVQKLVAGEAAAPKDLEQALTDIESASSDVSAAEAQIDSSRQRLDNFGKTEAEIEQLAETRHADRTTRVMAPIGGLIVGRKVGPGQYIRPDNPDPLFTVADTSTMWLLAQLYESQILIVRAGQKVEVKVLALPNQSFPAQVSFIAPAIDPATRRVAVRCVVRNKNNQLRPEMFASFRFEQAPRRALLVPQKAVVREGNLAVVWVLEDGSHISRRPVELGGEIDGDIEIKSGLRAGETVVADGALFLSSFVKG